MFDQVSTLLCGLFTPGQQRDQSTYHETIATLAPTQTAIQLASGTIFNLINVS